MSNSFFSDGKPVTEYFEYYPDGKLFRKIVSVDGKLNGDSIEYYPSGILKKNFFWLMIKWMEKTLSTMKMELWKKNLIS